MTLNIFFFFYFSNWLTDPTFRVWGWWEMKHFMGMAERNNKTTLYVFLSSFRNMHEEGKWGNPVKYYSHYPLPPPPLPASTQAMTVFFPCHDVSSTIIEVAVTGNICFLPFSWLNCVLETHWRHTCWTALFFHSHSLMQQCNCHHASQLCKIGSKWWRLEARLSRVCKTNFNLVSSGTIQRIVANTNSLTFPKYMAVNRSTILLIFVTSDFRRITNLKVPMTRK